jgi:hypothetical protein
VAAPGAAGAAEKANPGSEGITTSKLSRSSAPWAAGSVSSGASLSSSANVPGQPWVSTSGNGSGPAPRWCTKCTRWPPTSAVNWAKEFRYCSWARQSNADVQ